MLTIATYKNEKQVEKYFEEHLSSGEYHSEKGDTLGTWHGKTAEHLGLSEGSVIKSEDFKSLVRAIDPRNGKSFLIRKKSNRIIAREMSFSAPKSVSILAITMGDKRLIEAHQLSVAAAFRELESMAESKVRRGLWVNADGKRATGNIIAARFTHKTSRALDPQLHTHNVVFNVTFDVSEKRLKALDPHAIFMGANYISEIYRAELAQRIRSLGYDLEMGKHTFRIKGVSPEMEALFSKRSLQIEKAAEKLFQESGVEVDTRGRAILAETTRRAKDHQVTEADYLSFQRSQLGKSSISELQSLIDNSKERATGYEALTEAETKSKTREVLNYALKHVFERASVIPEKELIRAVLKQAQGQVVLRDVKAELQDPRYLRRGESIMTREERAREVRILSQIRTGKRTHGRFIHDLNPIYNQLQDDQKNAVASIALCRDQYVFMRGVAGSGKTFALSTINESFTGKKPIFLAPTGSATETLRTEGFKEAKTLQYYLANRIYREQTKKGVIILGEAGLISTRQMDVFLRMTKNNNTRVIFVGDTRQHNSVEGGDALRLIEDYSVIEKVSLSQVKRQRHHQYKEAIQKLAEGDIKKGFSLLDGMGAIKQSKSKNRYELIANEYVEAIKKKLDTLIVSPTNREIEVINSVVRRKLKTDGLIETNEHSIKVFKSLNMTTAEKSFYGNYEEGQILSFHKSKGEFKQGEVLVVHEIKDSKLITKDMSGKIIHVNPVQHQSLYDIVGDKEKPFAKGDKIIIKANYATSPTNRIPNGTIATIEAINEDGTIALKNGKVLGENFRQFDHAYAITSQASQGKTAEKVILSARSKSGMALSKNQFYVSCSRGRDSVSIHTDDKAQLLKAVTKSSARRLVIEELVRDRIVMKASLKMNVMLERAIEKSRDLIEKSFVKYRGTEKYLHTPRGYEGIEKKPRDSKELK